MKKLSLKIFISVIVFLIGWLLLSCEINVKYETIEKKFNDTNNTKQSTSETYLKKIDVKYDKENHIPIKIYYDYYVPPIVVVDGTFDYEIGEFAISD